MANILPSEGCTLEVSTNIAVPVYTVIAQVTNIGNMFDWSNEAVDTPDLARTTKTHRAGLQPDWGTLPFTIHYDPKDASHIILEGLLDTPALALWRFTDSDTTANTRTGEGSLTKFSPTGIDEDSNITADVEVKLSGPMTKG